MVGVVQWLRSPTVTRRMLGSIPAAHPSFKGPQASRGRRRALGAGHEGVVAQLVRALACHARGRGFEPRPSRQNVEESAFLFKRVAKPTTSDACRRGGSKRASPRRWDWLSKLVHSLGALCRQVASGVSRRNASSSSSLAA
jgi:hypothetical protein